MDGFVLLACLAFGYSLVQAAWIGVKAARDPVYRVTPLNPHTVFWRVFKKRIRNPLAIWCLAVAALATVHLTLNVRVNPHFPWIRHVLSSLTLLAMASGFQAFFLGATLFFSVRAKTDALLFGFSLLGAIIAYGVSICVVMLGLPDGMNTLVVKWELGGVPVRDPYPLFPFYNVGIAFLALGGIWFLAWRKGDRWFRFQE